MKNKLFITLISLLFFHGDAALSDNLLASDSDLNLNQSQTITAQKKETSVAMSKERIQYLVDSLGSAQLFDKNGKPKGADNVRKYIENYETFYNIIDHNMLNHFKELISYGDLAVPFLINKMNQKYSNKFHKIGHLRYTDGSGEAYVGERLYRERAAFILILIGNTDSLPELLRAGSLYDNPIFHSDIADIIAQHIQKWGLKSDGLKYQSWSFDRVRIYDRESVSKESFDKRVAPLVPIIIKIYKEGSDPIRKLLLDIRWIFQWNNKFLAFPKEFDYNDK